MCPYGNSYFFSVRKSKDPIGFLPERVILGIDKHGVHFIRSDPRECLHSALLRDILKFGSRCAAVFSQMTVARNLHTFQFETKQVEEICVPLQTRIHDVMLRCNSELRSVATTAFSNGDLPANSKLPFGDVNEKHVQDLSKAIEESQKTANLENLTKEDARQQLLRVLQMVPYGNSVFSRVRKIHDPIRLLPRKIILGNNKHRVHFFWPDPEKYLFADLRSIQRYGSGKTAVYFKMRVAGVLHEFLFETKQGEEIRVALEKRIDDLSRRNTKACSAAATVISNGDLPANSNPPTMDVNKKRVQDLSEALEESQKTAKRLEELHDNHKQEKEHAGRIGNIKRR